MYNKSIEKQMYKWARDTHIHTPHADRLHKIFLWVSQCIQCFIWSGDFQFSLDSVDSPFWLNLKVQI